MPYQDYTLYPVRASTVLTTGYVAGTVISPFNANPALRNQLNLLIAFTVGMLTSASIKVEYSHDGTTYFQETFIDISGAVGTMTLGTYKMTATGNYMLSIPIKSSYIRVSAIGEGTVTNSLLAIDAVVGTV